jgi:catechol 2,3-dioxygenase-like lactoylglutathione lyase family enzyme
VDIGHVHLKVADIDRALAFYVDVLGFEEQARYGDQAAFISAGLSPAVARWSTCTPPDVVELGVCVIA